MSRLISRVFTCIVGGSYPCCSCCMAVWHHCGNCNEVTVRHVQLVPGWVTVFGWTNHLGMQPATRPTQPPILPYLGQEMSSGQCGDAVQLGSKSRHGALGMVVAWHSGNVVGRWSYTLRRAGLVLGWVTVLGGQTISVFHQAIQASSTSYPQRDGK